MGAPVPVAALSGALWDRDWILPLPSIWTLCSSLVLAAGGAALAGLAPAGRDTMLQVSLGRMELVYLSTSAHFP